MKEIDKSKIGIITHYFNSVNYGGNLQAYALVSFLNSNNYNAEQICYSLNGMGIINNKGFKEIKYKTIILIKKILSIKEYNKTRKYNNIANMKFSHFNKNIIRNNHFTYNDDNICKIGGKYDYLIIGSDQVWNPTYFKKGFYLDFVEDNNKKIAYAASIGCKGIECDIKNQIINRINRFKFISVREREAKELLSKYIDKKIEVVVDPTLLITKDDWDKIKSKEVKYNNYILCYFLGDFDVSRKLVFEFAQKKNLKIVNIIIARDDFRYFYTNFGDFNIIPSPEEFITLIENANYIFTDSFHACIFSYIYNKQYFVFNRDKYNSMNSRIYDLLDLFDMKERFCDTEDKLNIDYLISMKDFIYKRNEKLEKEIEKSKNFLINSLNG